MGIAATLQMGLPGRARLHYGIFDISLLIFVGKILSESLTHRTLEVSQKLIITLCALYGIYVLTACADMRLKWERMLASIAVQKAMDKSEIVVEAQTFISYYANYTGWSNPSSNPNEWPNNVYARIFGVQKFIAR